VEIKMSAKLMEEMAIKITLDLMHAGLTPHQGMMVLAHTAAVAFRADKLSRKEAIQRFTQVVDSVYNEAN
jgi:hypothetical protein